MGQPPNKAINADPLQRAFQHAASHFRICKARCNGPVIATLGSRRRT